MLPIKEIGKNLGGVISKNSPTILTGVAVAGFITTVIFAIRATPKAILLLEKELENKDWAVGYDENGKLLHQLTKLEIIKLTYRCYIPTAAVGLASIGCIIGANGINLRRNAALASVYSITEAAFKEYQAKVTETIGRNKELKVRDEIAADTIRKNPPSSNEVIITGNGDVMCYDAWAGRYFESNMESIKSAENRINKTLRYEDHVTLNDLYYELGLGPVDGGNDIGWHIETGEIDFYFSSQLSDIGKPCLVIKHNRRPTPMY